MQSFEKKLAEHILIERGRNGAFKDFDNFLRRVQISLEQLEILININAFRFTGRAKRELLIEAYIRLNKVKKTQPVATLFEDDKPVQYKFPELQYDKREEVWEQIKILGFPL